MLLRSATQLVIKAAASTCCVIHANEDFLGREMDSYNRVAEDSFASYSFYCHFEIFVFYQQMTPTCNGQIKLFAESLK